jgi:hypothetical protein
VLHKGVALLRGELCHPVQVEEDLDWSMEDSQASSGRYVKVTLRKMSPVPGSVLWWNCLLIGDPCIEVDCIEGRSTSKGKQFQENWNAAMEAFKQKVSNIEPFEVDLS